MLESTDDVTVLQVLLLDYDCTPLINPTALFEGPHMALHGNLFWPDLPDGGETRPPIKKGAEALGMNSTQALVRTIYYLLVGLAAMLP
jgi:hypothetical protein